MYLFKWYSTTFSVLPTDNIFTLCSLDHFAFNCFVNFIIYMFVWFNYVLTLFNLFHRRLLIKSTLSPPLLPSHLVPPFKLQSVCYWRIIYLFILPSHVDPVKKITAASRLSSEAYVEKIGLVSNEIPSSFSVLSNLTSNPFILSCN